MAELIQARNKHTGDKVWVPETYLRLFPKTLDKLPSQKAAETKAASKINTKES